jgi:hypothetical protein
MRRYFPFLLIVLALTARLLPGLRTIDDSYITYRYARNILAGNGFVFNQGERILGTTTPLYTLIMAASAVPFGGVDAPFPLISSVLNAFFDAATCILLFQIGKKFHYEIAGAITGLVWAVAPYSVTFAIGGLETSLYVLLLVSFIYFYIQRRYPVAWLLAALALLTRPDALMLIGLVGLHRIYLLFKKERLSVLEPVVFLIPVLAWGLFAFRYFGSPLPHSILAKSMAYHLESSSALIRLLQHYATPFMEETTLGPVVIGFGLILYPFLFIIGGCQAVKQNNAILPAVVFPWFYLLAFSVANPLIFRWYLTPPLPFYFLFILIGLQHFTEHALLPLLVRLRSNAPFTRFLTQIFPRVLLYAFPVVMSLLAWTILPDHGPQKPAPQMAWFKLEQLYRQAAAEIKPSLQPGDVIAAGDVGVLGYDTGAQILDTVGLNSAAPIGYYPLDNRYYVINYAIPPDLIIDQHPDFAIFLEVYGRKGLLQDSRFTGRYELLDKIPTDIYGSDGMLIYRRKS